jgi:hypothetical protein
LTGRPTRREHFAAAVVLALVLCAWFFPLLGGDQLGQSHILYSYLPWSPDRPAGLNEPIGDGEGDAALEYDPLLRVARDQIRDGDLPLWNPYSYAGMTLAGNFQTAIAFPLTWIAFVLPVGAAWGLMAALKLLIAGLGAYALVRRFGLSWGAGLAAGIVYMLSAPLVVWLQWPLATVFAVFPWVLLAADRLARSPDRRGVGLLALAVGALLLAGHPESAFLSLSAAAVYALALAGLEAGAREIPRTGVRFVAASVLGAGIGGVALLPFLDAWAYSITREAHDVLSSASIPLWSGIVWLMPNVFGAGKPDYAGPPFSYLTVAAYFGVVAILLAGVAVWREGGSPRARAMVLMAAVAAMAAFGVPPVSWVLENVPPWSGGNNQRVFFVVALGAAAGAATGFESLVTRPLPLLSVALWAGLLGLATTALTAVLALTDHLPASGGVERKAALLFIGSLVAGALLLAALGRVSRRVAVALAVAVVALEMSYLHDWNVMLPSDQAHPPTPAAVRALQNEPGVFRMTSFRSSPQEPLVRPPNTSALYGLEDAQGYDYPQPRRWADLSWFVLGWRGITRELNFLTPGPPRGPALTALRMANVRYYLAPPGTRRPGRAFRRVYDGNDGRVFLDAAALPRAYLVPRTHRATEDRALRILERGGLSPRRAALVPPDAPAAPVGSGFAEARVEVLSPDRVRVHVPPGGAGWLVLANSYSPSWSAEVDGRAVDIQPTNLALMGVPVTAGSRVAEFHARATWVWAGLALTLVSLVISVVLARPSRRTPSSAPIPGSPASRSA